MAHGNLARILFDEGDRQGCLERYDEAVRCDPSLASMHNNRAMALLLSGDFAQGWSEYEWRWKMPGALERNWPQPEWDGSPLAGRTILLHREQGAGDTLQFMRYTPARAGSGRATARVGSRQLDSHPQHVRWARSVRRRILRRGRAIARV